MPRTPTVAALDWRDDVVEVGAFPVVVASGVLVCVQWAEDVARVLAAVAAEARLVVVATQRRRDGVARFLEAASAHFTVEELREDSFHPDYATTTSGSSSDSALRVASVPPVASLPRSA